MSVSLSVYDKEHAAREKYIYFMCGLAGALVAYIGKDFHPNHPIDAIGRLTIFAMVSLVLCLVFGMANIQLYIKGISTNKDVLVADEEIANCVKSILEHQSGKANYSVNLKTGKAITVEQLSTEVEQLKRKSKKESRKMKQWFWWSTCCFAVSHIFLALGFILLIISKVVT